MPDQHARISPSAAERWLSCPASIRMGELVGKVESSSPYAEEGTAAHALGEMLAHGTVKTKAHGHTINAATRRWRAKYRIDDETEAEMQLHIKGYLEFIVERMKVYPNTELLLEQRMDTGVPNCWGTSDAVLVSPRHVEIIDLKYGQGIRVDAEENPQVMLYGVGALDMFGDVLGETEIVTMTIYQPRLQHTSSYSLTPTELRAWRDNVAAPRARLALTDDAPFGPSAEACRWCPASGQCKAQLAKVAETEFGTDPDLLDEDELAAELGKTKLIRQWLEALEAAALERAFGQGKIIPGYKVIASGGRRVISNQEAAVAMLEQVARERSQPGLMKLIKHQLAGIGELEKALGKDDFNAIVGPFVIKTEGRPSLVPESHRSQPINKAALAAADFEEEE